MERLKPTHFRISPETIHELDEIARIKGFCDGRAYPNRAMALRHGIRVAATIMGAVPYVGPEPEEKPTKKAGKKTSKKSKNCVDRVNTTVVE